MFKAGNVCYREPEKAHYKPVWMWRVHGREVACVLAIIHRYLFTKKEAAEIALEYFELAWTDRKDKQRLSDSVLALRESFSKRLKLTY